MHLSALAVICTDAYMRQFLSALAVFSALFLVYAAFCLHYVLVCVYIDCVRWVFNSRLH